jgi:mono/diheme cytochrome c family protein
MTIQNPRAFFAFKSIVLACALVLSGCATSQSDGAHSASAGAGKALARDLCSGCHAIGGAGDSANPAAPPFRDLLTRYTPVELEQKLPSGTLMGHPDLPSVRLSQQGAKDLVAYLEALRPTR